MAVATTVSAAAAQGTSKTYRDSRGREVVFPLGDASFADEIVTFAVGTPAPRGPRLHDPKTVIGVPDHNPKQVDPQNPPNLGFGCGGTLVVRFTDNVLVDVARGRRWETSAAAPLQSTS